MNRRPASNELSILWVAKRWRRFAREPSLVFSTSNRIRAYTPHSILRDSVEVRSWMAGVDASFLSLFRCDVAVFQKIYPGWWGQIARALGVLVVWDVCDAEAVPKRLEASVDLVVASSRELADLCRLRFPAGVAIEVIDDCHEHSSKWDSALPHGEPLVCSWYGTSASASYCVPFLKEAVDSLPGVRFRFSTNDAPPWNEIEGFTPGVEYHHDPKQTPDTSWQRFIAESHIGLVPVGPQIKSAHKALNYMAYGRPVVCTPTLNHKSIVQHGRNGLLAGSQKEWASCIEALRDDELRTSLGQEARRTAAGFSVSQMAKRYLYLMQGHRSQRNAGTGSHEVRTKSGHDACA